MLAVSGNLQIDSVSQSFLKRRNNSLLDLYFDIYLNEIESILHKGLVKKYRQDASNVKALKGRMNFAQNIRKNLRSEEHTSELQSH